MPNLRREVESVLEVIRNALRMEGGDIELVDIAEDGVVSVKLTGSCAGCPFSQMTLKNFVERELKKNVDGIKEVVAV
ncbi:MAG: NifU family protein [Methanothrix sp.]|jgi:Fe-S cluster biogenesis protein NfuA|uniref:Nitrogen-fixing NifU domain protein n=1 Tax=Methanothrix harundinacea TaxID=301375 RepID=A0A101IIW1_9EURY|nr:MAG: Nitrogen-fixing NifU domain protein [Methanothrix harundinacea]MDD2638047.1 NifU family protein [Methanothrix sp.]MDI9398936.1 NifU family protein [Euryarchaeota archaeon]KUK96006.1 MAG: Nitrogen-fixing NifU domain protein [Methanothrix harundinacea]MCP1392048.1 NifU family protein [Methanothrix harundinacea]